MAKNLQTEAQDATGATPCECSKYDAVPANLTEEQLAGGDYPIWTTGCQSTTKREFAPGHDAKLKSHLITWGAVDADVRKGIQHDTAEGWAKGYHFGYMVVEGIAKAKDKLAAKAERAAKKAAKPAKAERKLAESAGIVAPAKVADIVADEEAAYAEAEAKKVAEREASADWDDAPKVAEVATPAILEDEGAMNAHAQEAREAAGLVKAKVGRWEHEGYVNEDGSFTYAKRSGGTKTVAQGKYNLI